MARGTPATASQVRRQEPSRECARVLRRCAAERQGTLTAGAAARGSRRHSPLPGSPNRRSSCYTAMNALPGPLRHAAAARIGGATAARGGMSRMASETFVEPPSLDEVDERIVEMLKQNGRATNQQIARSLKIAAATVSARIRRLEQTKAIRVVAVSDFGALGFHALLALGI